MVEVLQDIMQEIEDVIDKVKDEELQARAVPVFLQEDLPCV